MKIGVYFTSSKTHGGIYQYSTTLLEALAEIPEHRYVIFTNSKDIPRNIRKNKRFKIIDLSKKGQSFVQGIISRNAYLLVYRRPLLIQTLYGMGLFWVLKVLSKLAHGQHIKIIEKEKMDLMFYSTSTNISFLCNVPAVVPIHDIMHRVHPQFPEVSANGMRESREYAFQNISNSAFRILVDSEVGKEDLINYYNPSSDR